MRVSFVTSDQQVPSTVEYGKTPGSYEASATGEHTQYTLFPYTSGKIHHVVIGPLEPRTTYHYRCGGSGPEFSLRTPTSTLPIEFVVVGKYSLVAHDFARSQFINALIEVEGPTLK